MGQVSRKSDHNPPSVRFKCILVNFYKPKKHLDHGHKKIRRDIKREKNHPIILSSSNRTQGQTLSQFSGYVLVNVTISHIVLGLTISSCYITGI